MSKYRTKGPLNKYFIIAIILLIVSLAILFTYYDSKRIKKLHSDYYKVKSIDEIRGIITDLYVSKGASFLILNHFGKYYFVESRNCQNDMTYFHEFAQLGDSINKQQNTDTFRIIRGREKTYYFILGKVINSNK